MTLKNLFTPSEKGSEKDERMTEALSSKKYQKNKQWTFKEIFRFRFRSVWTGPNPGQTYLLCQIPLSRCEKEEKFEAKFHLADIERTPSQCYVPIDDLTEKIFQVRLFTRNVTALTLNLGVHEDSGFIYTYRPLTSPFFVPFKIGLNADLWSCLHVILKRSKVPLTKTMTLTVRVNEPLQTHSVRQSAHHTDVVIKLRINKACSHVMEVTDILAVISSGCMATIRDNFCPFIRLNE